MKHKGDKRSPILHSLVLILFVHDFSPLCFISGRKFKRRKRSSVSQKQPQTPEELAAMRRQTAERVRKWREKKKAQLGIDAYHNIQNQRKKEQYVLSHHLPEDQLEERRRQNRVRQIAYRERQKLLNYSLPDDLGLLETE